MTVNIEWMYRVYDDLFGKEGMVCKRGVEALDINHRYARLFSNEAMLQHYDVLNKVRGHLWRPHIRPHQTDSMFCGVFTGKWE